MPRLIEISNSARTAAEQAESAALFPGSLYGEYASLTEPSFRRFEAALIANDEEAVQGALSACPYLLQYVIPNSGHHGTWAFPKQMIRTGRPDGVKGLIPDFLVATRSSLGFTWHILELKRPATQFSNADGSGYSTTGHKAIAQCAAYHAHFRDYIETVRSNIGIIDLITPKNVILLIGDAEIESPAQRICRANFEAITHNVVIASYDRIRRGVQNDRPQWFANDTKACMANN